MLFHNERAVQFLSLQPSKARPAALSSELLSTLEQMASILDGRLFNRCDVIGFGIIPSLKFKGFILFCFFLRFHGVQVSDYA